MAYVITSPCIGEKAGDCVEVCPVDCIIEGEDQFYIDPDSCLDCGACEVVCPASAIYYEEDIPEGERWFIEKAKQFFQKTND